MVLRMGVVPAHIGAELFEPLPGLMGGPVNAEEPRESSPIVESLVWTVKSWWGVQGVRPETRRHMAAALARAVDWAPGLFQPAV